MLVRGLDVVVLPVAPDATGADAAAADLPAGTRPEEGAIRAACAEAIAAATGAGAVSLALPGYGLGAGASPVMCARILAQEAVRAARSGSPRLRRIVLCCPWPGAFEVFQKTVDGYLRHLLEVLIWGPFVTVDALIELPDGIVVIRRSNPPLGYALPGGFVDYGESLEEAVRREAMEETGLDLLDLRQMHTYSDPGRDPRFHTISTVFMARAEGRPRAGDDAADVRVVRPGDVLRLPFAFDHAKVLADWLARRDSQRAGPPRGAPQSP